jgi:uncharacterized protein with HEPN domain
MRRDARVYLWDIREAADAIATFIADLELADYASSPLVHSAVERKFEIIGEALNGLAKVDPDLARCIPDIERIVAFRNLLIHGYAVVEHARVYAVARQLLPQLRDTVQNLLVRLDS